MEIQSVNDGTMNFVDRTLEQKKTIRFNYVDEKELQHDRDIEGYR